jgi:hypothetical protein
MILADPEASQASGCGGAFGNEQKLTVFAKNKRVVQTGKLRFGRTAA